MASTSLTGIFAPGSPALVESLRTLTLDPKRTVAPGETIRVDFSFSNLGGAPATGVRVRFSHPQGVVHVVDADRIDDHPLDGGERLIDATGAAVGDLEPNAQRRVSCSFQVNDTIEDGSSLTFQAALVTDQTPLVGSNIEHIVVRSRPDLRGSGTLVTISAADHPKPGDVVTVRATIVNTGSSSAHDIVVLLPAPEHTSYVARSARIDGRLVLGIDGEAFDYDSTTIVSERLAPGQTTSVEYQATIDSPLPDGTRIKAVGSAGSREVSEFALTSSEILVSSPVDFDGDDTSLTLLCDDVVTPGMRVPMILRAVNAGTGIAQHVTIDFTLPPGLMYAPGSAHVDGQPVSDDSINSLTFGIGSLAAGRVAEIGLAATVAVPVNDQPVLPIEATLRWRGGSRTFARRLTVRVAPRFNRVRNYVEADRGIAQARDDVRFTVHVYNDGTAPERNVRLRLIPGAHLDDVRVAETPEEPLPYFEPLGLGIVQPHHERLFTVSARVASKVPDRSNVALSVVLEHDDGAIDLGTATVVVRSRPHVARESAAWELVTHEPLRPNRTADVVVRFHNSGSDVLHDARMMLTLPPELAVERAVDARRDRDGLVFGDVSAETVHEARLTLRLLRPVPRDRALMLEGWLHGRGISPVQFEPLDVPAFAEPAFAETAQLTSVPSETINAGDRMHYEIRLRNDGDGPAERLLMRVVPANLAVYVPSSTTINGMPVSDDAGASQLWSQRGLVLADINPGVELRVRWEMMVMTPLAAGTALDTRAILEWGQGETLALAAPTLRVQAQPALGETTAGTPISIARIFPSEAPSYEPPRLPEPQAEFVTPAIIGDAQPPRAIAEVIERGLQSLDAQEPHEIADAQFREIDVTPSAAECTLYLDFTPERLTNTVRMLERSDAGGLVQHLFALRLLLPEHARGASPQLVAALASGSRAMKAPLERLFVRSISASRLTITAKDLEDRESREAFRAMLHELANVSTSDPEPPGDNTVRISGPIDLTLIRSLAVELETAPLGAVTPWLINAQLLGTTIAYDGERSDALGSYRKELLKVLGVLAELPIAEFHRVLTSSVNRTLDESLAAVLDALRGAAHIAVE